MKVNEMYMKLAIATFCLWVSLGSSASGQNRDSNLDHIDIYLHTFDAGDMIYTNFGHTAIRVVNRDSGRDLVYNWGIFDFGDPLTFSLNYYIGNLMYKLGVYPGRQSVQRYRFEGRTIWEDKLNFTSEQKKVILERLQWNSKPENREYLYQYFFDNCATRPRDFIDLAFDNKLKNATEGQSSERTFRSMVRDGYNVNPWMDVILEVGMNSQVDRVMTRWESMFHPIDLRQELFNLKVDGQPALVEGRTLYTVQPPEKVSFDVFKFLALLLGVPLLASLGLIQGGAWKASKQLEDNYTAHGLRLLGAIGFVFFLVGGIFGFLMPLNWIFSGHTDLHHNFNMMLFLPFDILLVPLFAILMVSGKAKVLGKSFFKILKRYMGLHLIMTLALTISWGMGDLSQNLDRVVYLSPIAILLLGLAVNFGIKQSGK